MAWDLTLQVVLGHFFFKAKRLWESWSSSALQFSPWTSDIAEHVRLKVVRVRMVYFLSVMFKILLALEDSNIWPDILHYLCETVLQRRA